MTTRTAIVLATPIALMAMLTEGVPQTQRPERVFVAQAVTQSQPARKKGDDRGAPAAPDEDGINPLERGGAADMSPSGSSRLNVLESQRYDKLIESNRAFRQARMKKECGPITDPELRQSCLASFSQDEPYTGSSKPRHRSYHSETGR